MAVSEEIRELYQQVILDHNKRPRNFCRLEESSHHADGYNPLCGDKVTVFLQVKNDTVEAVSFQGSGCAISTASASLMTEIIMGKTLAEAQAIFTKFHQLVTGEIAGPVDLETVGKLAVFGGISEFPVRVKCATLAWHTMMAALENTDTAISTE